METLFDNQYDYTFSKDSSGQLILSVLCGSVGLFEVDIVLNRDETDEYNKNGKAYIENLAQQIRYSPSAGDRKKN